MRIFISSMVAIALCASTAQADDYTSSRDVQDAVDSYLATSGDDAGLVGGTGSAGYDAGFWIRGGDFLLRINATLQARYEALDYEDEDFLEEEDQNPNAGDLSGFSLPRATLKFSGEAPCNICYYVELEFGHFGRDLDARRIGGDRNVLGWPDDAGGEGDGQQNLGGMEANSFNYDNTREAWIEWCYCPTFNVRMGQVQTPNTRQLLTAPELQQFVDISIVSSVTGLLQPGYTDRNRDHGILIHGAFGCNNEWSYMAAITNGDGGDSIRNVLDHRSSDNMAYSARINWAFLAPIGYEEGALRQQTCQWYGEVGVWGHAYADRIDKSHAAVWDNLTAGLDVAIGYGGFSFTGAVSYYDAAESEVFDNDISGTLYLAQLGYHFPGTAWEIAARYNGYAFDVSDDDDVVASAWAIGVNYYLNGHANKLQLDFTMLMPSDADGELGGVYDPYAGWNAGFNFQSNISLLRFQWQLAL